MPETMTIAASNLLIDAENPRLVNPSMGQHEVLRAIAEDQGKKLQALAADIVTQGSLDPTSLPIVTPLSGEPNRYVVLEGNRRLAALRTLENPELLAGADITRSVLAGMRRLSKEYHKGDPIEFVTCAVFAGRSEADHWIRLRHTGERGGAGVVRWDSEEEARYAARGGMPPPHIQVLDFLQGRGDLTAGNQRGFPTASLQRLIGTRAIQDRMGFEIRDGQLMLRGETNAVAKVLLHMVKQLASGEIKTANIYKLADRKQYAANLPKDLVVTPTRPRGQGMPVSTAATTPSDPTKRGRRTGTAKPRGKLIPHDCVLSVTDARCHQIETELRKLKLEETSNAVSVLFRVFVELTADAYIDRFSLTTSPDAKLRKKLQDVTEHLIAAKKMNRRQATPVRRVLDKNSFLAPSTALMNEYVHNQYVFPIPSDLRSYWDNLQPFFTAAWSA